MEPMMMIYIGCMVVLSLAASKKICKKNYIKIDLNIIEDIK